ncbi:flagellar biosynthesis anti-sigma factor FlgM [Gayadomonas joobiniege]|uniref:flagellar biosynthesis anti-sigma factor FlgM n=1 Tax=Gayadomonas joobiniege TaxID=1234606 RepID=UPI00037D87D2|nr:flagellar biosynthesis anti-sigma factor FlgM [Gayadomonas joobiniege]
MAININTLNKHLAQAGAQESQQRAQGNQELNQNATQNAQRSGQLNSSRQDAVSLTQTAQNLNNLNKKSQSTSGFDENKVERLKKAIEAGEYKVDAEKLAANMIASESKLFGL